MNNFCECKQDGYCLRYERQMIGRFRQICAGINVDIGTAAAFRELWRQEVLTMPSFLKLNQDNKPTSIGHPEPTKLLLKTNQAPGDAIAMTAAIYSLHKAHPNKYLTAVESAYPEVFAHNPDVVPAESIPDALPLEMHYPAIHQSNHRGIHFMQAFCEHLSYALGINVPLLTNRPHLYFPDTTQQPIPQGKRGAGDYWVICSGGKNDLTNKLWGFQNYAKVLWNLKDMNFVQVGLKREEHQRLHGAYDLVGKTNLRQLFDIVRESSGVLCGVSLLMHVAAALEKPCIVIAGGREPVAWNAYPKQHYLHTIGMLPCSDTKGNIGGACWRSRVVPQGDNEMLDKDTCLYPVDGIPKCMRMIDPKQVVDLILKYNEQY